MEKAIVLAFSAFGACLGIGLAALGAALADGNAASKMLEGTARQPEMGGKLLTNMLISIGLIESIPIIAAVIAIVLVFANPFVSVTYRNGEGIPLISINGTLLFQFLNFFVLVAILAKFAYKPMLKVLEERRNKISSDLNDAEQSRLAAEKLKADYEQQLQTAQEKAQAIIDKAVKQAEAEGQAQLDAIRTQIAREKELAHAEIVSEREAALREMRQEVVSLSMAVAEKLLEKNMDTDMNSKLIKECMDRMDAKRIAR